jgi:hypothetical protein
MLKETILQILVRNYHILNLRFRSWLCLHAAPPLPKIEAN